MTRFNREDPRTVLPQLEKKIPVKISDLADDVGLVTHDKNGNVTLAGSMTLDGHATPIGWYDSHYSTTSVANGTSYVAISASAITLSVGRYIMFGSARFAGNATGYRGICIMKGSTSLGKSYASQQALPSASWTTSLNCSIFEVVESPTTYYLGVYQNSGGALNVSWDFYAVRIR